MIIIKGLEAFGDYCTLMWRSISVPEKWKEFFRRYLNEISKLGIDSIPLILIVSLFIGCLCTILIKLNMESPLLPRYTVGFSTREIILLEFSSSILCLILSGKIGSNIASEIGTMRVTEQIDALDIMGVNSANYLIMPKVLGLVTIMPFLVIITMATALFGGWAVCFTGILDPDTFIYGIQTDNQIHLAVVELGADVVQHLTGAIVEKFIEMFYFNHNLWPPAPCGFTSIKVW